MQKFIFRCLLWAEHFAVLQGHQKNLYFIARKNDYSTNKRAPRNRLKRNSRKEMLTSSSQRDWVPNQALALVLWPQDARKLPSSSLVWLSLTASPGCGREQEAGWRLPWSPALTALLMVGALMSDTNGKPQYIKEVGAEERGSKKRQNTLKDNFA